MVLYQVGLPIALPLLDLLFARHCCFGCLVRFEPDEPVYPVARGEPGYSLDLVFPYSPGEFGGDTEGPIGLAREEIDIEHRASCRNGSRPPPGKRCACAGPLGTDV